MPKIVDREQYRKQLLTESFELFAEIGYGKITMRQLAQKLRISTGTLYHYFPSKEAIFLQLVEELAQRDISNFLIQAESVPPDIRSRVGAILEFTQENRDYFAKQLTIWMDYYQQQAGEEDVSKESLSRNSITIFEQLDRETIAAINNYLQVDNYTICEFISTFINGLLLCQLYQPNFKSWDAQAEMLVEAVVLMSNK
ncbi:TetR/AcrR family transcriptional regulator [Chamaesiphon sp. OTE_75_metabat_556]|jgi:AcrR family transcriptional regulator|uniref:TetR/AcrR family transcriptional regulator n=1 Tax=Chamaesiphon sp. OTE_75_metabat_556 TaxID=2964692 RepID=UPI00286C4EE1|nr:TetR/AcrR family transcriptional regulator [Chamaesiphon sp. OTE_75_metabat_556]